MTSSKTPVKPMTKKEKSALCLVPREHPISKAVLQKVLEMVGDKERPGIVSEENLRRMVSRFQDTFGSPSTNSLDVEEQFKILREKTQKLHGPDATGIDYSKNFSRVYKLFPGRLSTWERVFFTMDVGETSSAFSQFLSIFLMITIVISILNWMLGTMPESQVVPSKSECPSIERGACPPELLEGYQIIEVTCIYIFTFEYLAKFFTAHSVRFEIADHPFMEAFLSAACQTGKMPQLSSRPLTQFKFVTRGSSLIDLVSIAPFWFEQVAGAGSGGSFFVILRILRLTRIFRVFKLGKYNEVFSLFGRVMKKSQPALYLMLFFLILGMCLFGTLMWFSEQGTWYPAGHPELEELGIADRGAFLRDVSVTSAVKIFAESPFASILHSFWFVMVTVTTVGYGDMYPTTGAGKFFGTLTILSGIIVLAMPVGVIGSVFEQEYAVVQAERNKQKKLRRMEEVETAVREAMKHPKEPDAPQKEDDEEDDINLSQDLQLMFGLLDKSTVIENEITELLPPAECKYITEDLRSFARELLMSRDTASQRDLRVRADELLFAAFSSLRSVLRYEPGADPAPADILSCRRHLIELVTGCWAYWQEYPPRVEHIKEAIDMKADMTTRLQAQPSPLPVPVDDPGPAA
eukprot:gnl/MRDRNA2_/MRDRNA2_107078_c0_seq1.p1 gnl/MRDRNA2_/MRDRNA2_107078_c0~~gnl/MRDRNA2_/MRDRNA2_107078_c0_seq1.p1  ORF type:complete len:634 (+),score=97.76 gnl/MRDRNA2_/MRDRNA2_107078_c0_seq1:67-1968(+)